jgi:pimeloyl-ACP methyl ester carboxylesterase
MPMIGVNGVWIGHSVGRMIGMRLAVSHPEVINSLILINNDGASRSAPNCERKTGNSGSCFAIGIVKILPSRHCHSFSHPQRTRTRPSL